jgi:hypothetical protein
VIVDAQAVGRMDAQAVGRMDAQAAQRMDAQAADRDVRLTLSPLDAPYDTLATLPRELWLPGVVTACGSADARLHDLPRWYDALLAGRLPPPTPCATRSANSGCRR